jgi:hypothetical protein
MYAYNPRKKSYAQLENSLVGDDRWDILNGILSELALKKGESPKQHWMLVGARGMGKSHLLTLLHHKVCGDKKLRKLWIPVLFPEEIRMAGDLAKFLERALSEVMRDLENGKSPVVADLKDKITRIRSVRHDERVEYLFSLLTWIRRETGRHILIITENLQQLLGKRISILDQKKLRAFLQSEDALLMIGSATTIFTALHDHSHPFYHFFHIRRLHELSFVDIRKLVENLLCGHDTEEHTRIMADNEARLRVIHSFTGGNPRMAVFLSDILKSDINEEMIQIMDRILDELTPYFEAIINDTPEYLHDVINSLALYEPAQSPKEIAGHLEMEQGTVRNYLKQAKESGYVRVAFGRGKSNYYCLNEYLYRAWFQMRDSSHREDMRWVMELLLLLYTKDYILSETDRIEQISAENMSYYQKLIVQTAEFIGSNPQFCKIIELYSTSLGQEECPAMVTSMNSLQGKLNKLFKNKKYRPSEVYGLIRESFIEAGNAEKTPLMAFFAYLLGISWYMKGTYDISTALADYDSFVESKLSLIDGKTIEVMIRLEGSLSFKALIFIATRNYNLIDTINRQPQYKLHEIEMLAIDTLLLMQTIKSLTTGCNYNVPDIIDVIGKLHKQNMISHADKTKYFFNILISNAMGIIDDRAVETVVMTATQQSSDYGLWGVLWVCIYHEKSEEAQRLMAEKPIADMVSILKENLSAARARGKSVGIA